MRQLGNRFVAWNDVMRNNMYSELRNLTSQLESDWQGVSRQRYDGLLQDWESTLNATIQNGEDLGHHLSNTAQQFDDADNA
jgi:WXG100 family type VII secretion target